jgi:SAM-dependent methyltransferase
MMDYVGAVDRAMSRQTDEVLAREREWASDPQAAAWNAAIQPVVDYAVERTCEVSDTDAWILDVGIGSGIIETSLAAKLTDGQIVFGVDKEPPLLHSYEWGKTFGDKAPIAVCGDIREPPFAREAMDTVVDNGGLTHVYGNEIALDAIRGMLRVGGFFVLTEPQSARPLGFVSDVESWNLYQAVGLPLGREWLLAALEDRGFSIVETTKGEICEGYFGAVAKKME